MQRCFIRFNHGLKKSIEIKDICNQPICYAKVRLDGNIIELMSEQGDVIAKIKKQFALT